MAGTASEVKTLSDRAFGLVFAGVFLVLAGVGWVFFGSLWTWAVGASALFLCAALIAPWVLLPLNRLWMWFAHGLGKIVNFVLLGVFFFALVLPFGLGLRVLGKDPMKRKLESSANSYWTSVNRQANSETFPDMF